MAAINRTSPAGKGLRTGLQSVFGSIIGLVVVVWAVPGVPEAVIDYASANWLPLLLTVGVPSGVVAWLQNKAEEGK